MGELEYEARTSKGMDKNNQNNIIVWNGDELTCEGEIYRPITDWSTCPDLILEDVFRFLNLRERYRCSMVCKDWFVAFYFPRVWQNLVIEETTFTYTVDTAFGTEIVFNHNQAKHYLDRVGEHTRRIIIHQNFNFYILCDFITILASFLHIFQDYPMPHLEIFEFTFACESRIPIVGPVVLGTGGQFLDKLIELLAALKNLKRLILNFLLIEFKDAPRVLKQVVNSCHRSLEYLQLLDFTKEKCPLFQVPLLKNLKKLVLSPHQISDDVMLMLANSTELEDIVFVQDKYSIEATSISADTWKVVRQVSPSLRVHIHVTGLTKSDMLLQEKAPVYSIMHNTPFATIHTPVMHTIVENYRNSIRVFGHLRLPRKHGPRTFHCRADSGLVALVRCCPNLQKLYIRERISTATLLIIAHEGRSLKELYVRRNGVILKSDWPKLYHWEEWRFKWLQKTAQSYDGVEKAVSTVLKQKWRMLTDAEYMRLCVEF